MHRRPHGGFAAISPFESRSASALGPDCCRDPGHANCRDKLEGDSDADRASESESEQPESDYPGQALGPNRPLGGGHGPGRGAAAL